MTRRLVILTSEFPPWSTGGVGRYVAELAPRLLAGYEVHVVMIPSYQAGLLPGRDGPCAHPRADSTALALHTYGTSYRDALLAVDGELSFTALAAASQRVAAWCHERIGAQQGSVLYVQEYSLAPIAAALCSLWRSVAVMAACHLPVYAGFTYFDKPVRDAVHQVLEAKLVNMAQRVVVPSQFAAHVLAQTHNVADRVVVIPLGVERKQAARPLAHPIRRLLAVGRATEQKGAHLLIDTFERLHERHHDLTLSLVGGGASIQRLRTQVAASRAAKAIEIVPSVAHEDVWRVYDEHDLLVTASLYETFGLAVLEAMASLRVTLGFATPALSELWGHELGERVAVPITRTDALADRIEHYLGDGEKSAKLAEQLQHRAAHFSWARHVSALTAVVDGMPA